MEFFSGFLVGIFFSIFALVFEKKWRTKEVKRKGIQIGTKGIENRYRALMKYENEYQNGMEDKNMSMT